MINSSVVIPNWNGKGYIGKCLDSLMNQSLKPHVIVVENGSTDGSLEYLKKKYPKVELVINNINLGFAGGVNSGINRSIERGDDYVALLNNDAVVDKDWFKSLYEEISNKPRVGIATSKILTKNGDFIDSTGDMYTIWGLPYPRGRNEPDNNNYDNLKDIFAGSGGASIYRIKMLEEIGLFDEDFFAYFEDVDMGFRAQLAGWKVRYVPNALVYHQIGATSQKIKGFTTFHSLKNAYWLAIKNVPGKYLFKVLIRLKIALFMFYVKAIFRGYIWFATKSVVVCIVKLPKKIKERSHIQKSRRVNDEYIWNILIHDLPPNSSALRLLRSWLWKLTRRKDVNSN